MRPRSRPAGRITATGGPAFRDPNLNRLVAIAYDQNLTLMEAGARVLKARAVLGQAIGEVYPQAQQLNGNSDYIQPSRTDPSTNPNNVLAKNFWHVNLGGQVAWEIDLWGKFRHGVESADATYLASIASYDDVLVSLIGDVASDYIAIRTAQAQIAIAQKNVVKQKEALAIARDRFKGGATSELDVFQAQNVLAQTEAAIPQYTAQMQKQENALRVLLGEPPETIDGLLNHSRGIPSPPPTVAVGIPAELLRRRPDVRAAELKAVAQSAQVGMAEADLYPAFSLGGVLGTVASSTNGSSLNKLFTAPSISFAFGPSFSWPILNYGQITNNVRAQDAELQALLINYKNTVLGAQREVEDGLSGYRPGPPAGRLSAEKRRGGQQRPHRGDRPVPARHARLHHGADRRAESLSGAERSRGGRGQCLGQPHHGLSRDGRRLADPVGQGIRPGFRPRRDARAHQLGRIAPARRPAAAGDARAPRPV